MGSAPGTISMVTARTTGASGPISFTTVSMRIARGASHRGPP
jgi:hypothetical protein